MNKIKNITIIALIAFIFFSTLFPILSFATDITVGEKTNLIKERELPRTFTNKV